MGKAPSSLAFLFPEIISESEQLLCTGKCSTWAPDTSSNQIYWREQRGGEREENPGGNWFLVSSSSSLPSLAGSGVAGCVFWLYYKLDNKVPQTPENAVGFFPPLLWNTPSLMWRWRELGPWKREQLPKKFHPKFLIMQDS